MRKLSLTTPYCKVDLSELSIGFIRLSIYLSKHYNQASVTANTQKAKRIRNLQILEITSPKLTWRNKREHLLVFAPKIRNRTKGGAIHASLHAQDYLL